MLKIFLGMVSFLWGVPTILLVSISQICTMHYHFHKNIEEKCKLICGDVGGNVHVLLFSAVLRGPFKNEPGRGLRTLRHVDLQKRVIMTTLIEPSSFSFIPWPFIGSKRNKMHLQFQSLTLFQPHMLPEMQLVELLRIHREWVRQVSYYDSLHCVVSCATCIDSLLMCDIRGSKTQSRNMFRVEKVKICAHCSLYHQRAVVVFYSFCSPLWWKGLWPDLFKTFLTLELTTASLFIAGLRCITAHFLSHRATVPVLITSSPRASLSSFWCPEIQAMSLAYPPVSHNM